MLGWYLEGLTSIAIVTGVVYLVGRALFEGIGRGSSARRLHGRYVLWGCVGGYFVGGAVSPFLLRADTHTGMGGAAGFGLLAGWLVGTVAGGLVLAARRWRGRRADDR